MAVPVDLGDGISPRARLGVSHPAPGAGAEPVVGASELEDLRRRVAELESSMRTGER
jgi:hypothetical protein